MKRKCYRDPRGVGTNTDFFQSSLPVRHDDDWEKREEDYKDGIDEGAPDHDDHDD